MELVKLILLFLLYYRKFYRQDHQPNGMDQPIEAPPSIDSAQPTEIEEKVTSPSKNEALHRYITPQSEYICHLRFLSFETRKLSNALRFGFYQLII